ALRLLRSRRLVHFRVDPAEEAHIEKILAVARVVLASASVLASYLTAAGQADSRPLISTLLAIYLLYSVGVLLFLRLGSGPSQAFSVAIQLADVAWISLLTNLTGGANSPFFALFAFLLVAAAYRWEFWETICIGALIGLLYFIPSIYMYRTI